MLMNDYPDIHTHRSMEADGFRIINCSPDAFAPCPGQWYSVGIHPWSLRGDIPQEVWERLQAAVTHPQVLAIGEAGLDKLTDASMALQETVFIRQAKMADAVGKRPVSLGLSTDFGGRHNWPENCCATVSTSLSAQSFKQRRCGRCLCPAFSSRRTKAPRLLPGFTKRWLPYAKFPWKTFAKLSASTCNPFSFIKFPPLRLLLQIKCRTFAHNIQLNQ